MPVALRSIAGTVGDAVAHVREGLYYSRTSQLSAQPADGHPHRPRERVRMFVPGVFEKVFSAQETGLRSHQRLEYSKFFG